MNIEQDRERTRHFQAIQSQHDKQISQLKYLHISFMLICWYQRKVLDIPGQDHVLRITDFRAANSQWLLCSLLICCASANVSIFKWLS